MLLNSFKKVGLCSLGIVCGLFSNFNSKAHAEDAENFMLAAYPTSYGITGMNCNPARQPYLQLTLEGYAETYMKVTCYASAVINSTQKSVGGKTVFYVSEGPWTQTFPFDIADGVVRRGDLMFLTGINCMNDRNVIMLLTGFNGVSTCG